MKNTHLFRKGEKVKNVKTGRVMEVMKYIKDKTNTFVECVWYDLEKKELKKNKFEENNLLKAS
ncbi:MAG: hypothetical protein OEY34_04965 [Cyclobacteriaceae bacterium]|nr:hypothetical protein [Cyclobacteriaceae bacterium]